MMKFKCIKGLAIDEHLIIVQNDEVQFISNDEGFSQEILVIGTKGWCEGMELSFTPKQFVIHFESTVY